MNRQEALKLVEEKIKNKNLVKHCLAVEACMKGLSSHFGEDEDVWGLTGLLHDIDYGETKEDAHKHSVLGAQMLKDLDLPQNIVDAVRTHNEMHGEAPKSKMAKALFCVDPLTGLIVATTLVLPSKKISEVSVENILNRFKEKAFARGATREIIAKCSDIDLGLEEFVKISLGSMQRIANDIGL